MSAQDSSVFQYAIDNNRWQKPEKNFLELKKLSPGTHDLRIRTINQNGKTTCEVTIIRFHVSPPVWENSWFWMIFLFVSLGSMAFLQRQRIKRRNKVKEKKMFTQTKLADLEMQALKAQINPHFIFNCLNSIKAFIFEKDFIQADKYLDKFSELLRSTLDNSSSAIISLQEEIKYLDNYLQLEKLRFDNKFDYTINVNETIDKTIVFVPSMLLQPYVENALRHGIRHLENKKGKIEIVINKETGYLICKINDNGVGREKATALRNEMHIEYQSRGMQLSKRRAELYGIEQEIIDKKNEMGNASGTMVILKIPLQLKS